MHSTAPADWATFYREENVQIKIHAWLFQKMLGPFGVPHLKRLRRQAIQTKQVLSWVEGGQPLGPGVLNQQHTSDLNARQTDVINGI